MSTPTSFRGRGVLPWLAGLLLAASPFGAEAAPVIGSFYLVLNGGFVDLEDSNIDYGGALPNRSIRYDTGWGVSGAAGWRVLGVGRVEFEIAHRENDVIDVDPGFFSDGTVAVTTYMVNGYYDFPNYEGVVPHIGLGLGRAQFVHNVLVDAGTLSDSNSHAFAYQVIGGFEFPIVSGRLAATLEYRYLATTRPLFQDTSGFFYHSDYDSHSIFFGLRLGF